VVNDNATSPVLKLHRTLTWRTTTRADSATGEGLVSLWVEDCGTNYTCHFEFENIPFIHPAKGHINGDDAIQALMLCLHFLASLIEDAANHGHVIWWTEEGDFGGFV